MMMDDIYCFWPMVDSLRSALRLMADDHTLRFFDLPPSESSATWSKTIWSSTSSIRGRFEALCTRVGVFFRWLKSLLKCFVYNKNETVGRFCPKKRRKMCIQKQIAMDGGERWNSRWRDFVYFSLRVHSYNQLCEHIARKTLEQQANSVLGGLMTMRFTFYKHHKKMTRINTRQAPLRIKSLWQIFFMKNVTVTFKASSFCPFSG